MGLCPLMTRKDEHGRFQEVSCLKGQCEWWDNYQCVVRNLKFVEKNTRELQNKAVRHI